MVKRNPPGNRALLLGGMLLLLVGALVLISPAAVGNAVVRLVALVLAVTGVVQFFSAFRSVPTGQRTVSLVVGAVVAGLGVMVWLNPDVGSGFLTALLMIFFAIHGLSKMFAAFRYRPVAGWAWLLLSGLLSLLFVYLLWRQWPLAGSWAIGVLVGLDLLLTGLSLVLLALATRRVRSSDYLDTIQL